ncbi:MAG: glycosyltransferase [Candidatus Aminicenantes bacterium]|nr:glycosyltransferase [Candidatus Aminicenantes bacterium]
MSLFQIDAGKEWRGGQRQALLLGKELHKKGHPFDFYVQKESPLHKKALEAGLPVHPIKISSEVDITAILRLAWAMRRKKCKLVHYHDAHSAAIGAAAAKLAKVPIRVLSRRVDFPLKKNLLSRLKYGRDLDVIISISEGVKKVLEESGIDPKIIQVIPSGIDFSPFQEAKNSDYLRREFYFSPDDFLVGIVAHLADHKGHKYLIQAAEILKKESPKIKIIIVGEGPLHMELQKQVEQIHVEDMVFFLGFREDIPQILCSLDLFVLSSYLEGMGTSILDAMACKLPVVATKVGGIPEVVIDGETGFLVPPKRPASLAKAILKFYNNKELAEKMGEKGHQVVHEKFSAESMADRIIDLYYQLAKKKNIQLK